MRCWMVRGNRVDFRQEASRCRIHPTAKYAYSSRSRDRVKSTTHIRVPHPASPEQTPRRCHLKLLDNMTSHRICRLALQRRTFSSTRQLLAMADSIPAAFYRGGTSKAVMFQTQDLPADKTSWPSIFRSAVDSPDPNGRQLNGMGGGQSSTSKVCIVGPPSREDADVDYTFAAIGVKNDVVDMTSNCGNMTNAIGPYALLSGFVEASKGAKDMTVRIHNTNTGKVIHSTFPVTESGSFQSTGDFRIDGVAGGASRIQLDFKDPA